MTNPPRTTSQRLEPRNGVRAMVGLLAVVVAVAVAACSSGGSSGASSTTVSAGPAISVDQVTIDAPANPSVTVIRMVIHNDGGSSDALVGVSTPVASSAVVHRTTTDAAGRSTMAPQAKVTIPARSTVTFAPDGLHVMVTGIGQPLKVGERVPVELTFAKTGKVQAKATVVPPGTTQEDHHDHG